MATTVSSLKWGFTTKLASCFLRSCESLERPAHNWQYWGPSIRDYFHHAKAGIKPQDLLIRLYSHRVCLSFRQGFIPCSAVICGFQLLMQCNYACRNSRNVSSASSFFRFVFLFGGKSHLSISASLIMEKQPTQMTFFIQQWQISD